MSCQAIFESAVLQYASDKGITISEARDDGYDPPAKNYGASNGSGPALGTTYNWGLSKQQRVDLFKNHRKAGLIREDNINFDRIADMSQLFIGTDIQAAIDKA